MNNTPKSAGNAFIIVLILIALLAALTLTLTRMGSTTQDVSQEQAQVMATKLSRYGASLQSGVEGLVAKGCSEKDISFERPPFDGTDTDYINSNSPANHSCHLFHSEGSGMAYTTPDQNMLKGTSLPRYANQFVFSGYDCVPGVGSGDTWQCWNQDNQTDTDIVMYLVDVKDNICAQINKNAGINYIPIMHSANQNFFTQAESVGKYKGVFGQAGGPNSGHIYYSDGDVNGKSDFCFSMEAAGANIWYHVLLAR